MANEPDAPAQANDDGGGSGPEGTQPIGRRPGTGRVAPEPTNPSAPEEPLRPLRPKHAIRAPLARVPVTRRRLLPGRRPKTRRLRRGEEADEAARRPPPPSVGSEARGAGRDAKGSTRIQRLVDGVLYSRKPGGSSPTPRRPLRAVPAAPKSSGKVGARPSTKAGATSSGKLPATPSPAPAARPTSGAQSSIPEAEKPARQHSSSRRLTALARNDKPALGADENALQDALQKPEAEAPNDPARRSSSRYRLAAPPTKPDASDMLSRPTVFLRKAREQLMESPGAGQPAESLTSVRKLLASSIDSLVRSIRLGLPNLKPLIRRSTDILRSHPGTVFEVRPTCLLVDDEPTLEADENQGTWLVPAFMAGLRGLTLREEVLEDDVRKLCTELSNLEPKLKAIDQFRDWLWSGGAEGFRVTLDQSFTETMDAITSAEDGKNPFLVSPERALHSKRALGTLRPAWERDPNQRPSPFQLGLRQFSRLALGGNFKLGAALQTQLKAKTENRGAWMGAEVDAALAIEKLREAVPAEQLATRIQSRVLDGADASVLNLISLLFRGESQHRKEVREHLLRSGIGRLIAGHLELRDPLLLTALEELLGCAPEAVSRSAFRELLGRAVEDKTILKLCLDLVTRRGVTASRAMVDEAQLDQRAALPYARILWKVAKAGEGSGTSAASVMSEILGKLAPEIALSILCVFPPILSVQFQDQFQRLVVAGDVETRRKAIELLGSSALNGDVLWGGRVLLAALQESQAQGWDSHSLYGVLEKLLKLGLGRQLVALGLDRSLPTILRVGCIDVLDGQPELLAQVAAKRFTEFLEPQEVKRSLKTARIRLKESGR